MNKEFNHFIRKYTQMEIGGISIHCPYWMNKMKFGMVVVRGFENGKGDADSIQREMIRVLKEENIPNENISPIVLQKLAKRHRIGIDCSGFAYRFINELIRLKYHDVSVTSLDAIFEGGINKTNVKRFINPAFSVPIPLAGEIHSGDFIATKKTTHMFIVVDKTDKEITYAHSSYGHTKIKGVHTSTIQLSDQKSGIGDQVWLEQTNKGNNYNDEYFFPEFGDGVYRLKNFI